MLFCPLPFTVLVCQVPEWLTVVREMRTELSQVVHHTQQPLNCFHICWLWHLFNGTYLFWMYPYTIRCQEMSYVRSLFFLQLELVCVQFNVLLSASIQKQSQFLIVVLLCHFLCLTLSRDQHIISNDVQTRQILQRLCELTLKDLWCGADPHWKPQPSVTSKWRSKSSQKT